MKLHQHIITNMLVIFGMMFWGVVPSGLQSQTVVAMGSYANCSQTEVLVPIHIEKFDDIAAVTLHIQIDASQVEFVGVENINAVFTSGDFVGSINQQNQVVTITWVSFSPANLESGVMCDMRVKFNGEYADFVFNEGCELANSSLTVLPDVTYVNGSLVDLLSFEVDPMSQTIFQGGQATLTMVDLPDDVACQWQVMVAGDWVDVQDDSYYQGTHTAQLSILSVSEEMNTNYYRCMMTTGNCNEASQSSELLVIPNGLDEGEGANVIYAYPNPVQDILYCILGKALPNAEVKVLNELGSVMLYRYLGDVVSGTETRFDLGELPKGIYVLQVFSETKLFDTRKVIRN